jgi:hypothetical protein
MGEFYSADSRVRHRRGLILNGLQRRAQGCGMPSEPMLPESELRSRVLQYMEEGRLPLRIMGTRANCYRPRSSSSS